MNVSVGQPRSQGSLLPGCYGLLLVTKLISIFRHILKQNIFIWPLFRGLCSWGQVVALLLHAILLFSNCNVSLYVRPWRRKAVPSEILVKRLYIPDCKISLAFFVLYFHLLLIRSFIWIRSFFFVSWSLLKKLSSFKNCFSLNRILKDISPV